MTTAFTHALVGAATAQLAPPAPWRRRSTLAAALLAAVPDLDVAAFSLGIPYAHSLGHRGFSHSLAFALLAGLAGAYALLPSGDAAVERWRAAAVLTAATASHGVLDTLTDAGLGVGFLIPFDSTRFFFPWRPLETSPLGVTTFFSDRALTILRNEIFWIWLPVGSLLAATLLVRRRMRARFIRRWS